ncbi:hypothetical protein NL676_021679 [Syzygium grande]|nr:hypothetical protein NL676_021679 [Syzygium grande]
MIKSPSLSLSPRRTLSSLDVSDVSCTPSDDSAPSVVRIGLPTRAIVVGSPWSLAEQCEVHQHPLVSGSVTHSPMAASEHDDLSRRRSRPLLLGELRPRMDAPLQVARWVRMKRRDRWKKVMEVSLGLSLSMPLSLWFL